MVKKMLTDEQLEALIEKAAERAEVRTRKEILKYVKVITKIDPTSDKGIQELSEICSWARSAKSGSKWAFITFFSTIIGGVAMGFLYVIYEGVKGFLGASE